MLAADEQAKVEHQPNEALSRAGSKSNAARLDRRQDQAQEEQVLTSCARCGQHSGVLTLAESSVWFRGHRCPGEPVEVEPKPAPPEPGTRKLATQAVKIVPRGDRPLLVA